MARANPWLAGVVIVASLAIGGAFLCTNTDTTVAATPPAKAPLDQAATQQRIAKLIVHQRTRAEAIATMKRALREFVIEPIKTTIPACLDILSHNLFVKNKIDTGFVERNF